MDLSEQINNYLSKQNFSLTDYDIKYKDNCCQIVFASSEIVFGFVAYMTNLKFKNKFYKKLKIDIKYNPLRIGCNNNHKHTITEQNNNLNNDIVKSYKKRKKLGYKNFSTDLINEENFASIRSSGPYKFEDKLSQIQYIINKERWMGNKNFFCSINKNSFNRLIEPNRFKLKKIKKQFTKPKFIRNITNKDLVINSYSPKVYKIKISE